VIKQLLLAAFAAAAVVAAAPRVAHAQSQDFGSCSADLAACDGSTFNCCYRPFDPVGTDKAIIIPLDRCHQVVAQSGKYGPPGSAAPAWCSDAGPFSANDNGMYRAYGLVYRLMQRGIHVFWVINPTKDAPALTINQNANSQTYTARDIDFWVLASGASAPTGNATLTSCTGGCTPPVKRLDPTTLQPINGTYTKSQFPVRGSAFIIAPEDRAAFNDFWLHRNQYAGLAGNSYYDFSQVDLYEMQVGSKIVYQDFRTVGPNYGLGGGGGGAPVTARIDYAPPRLARQSPAGVSTIWLGLANLDEAASYPACLTGAFSPSDAVYCPTSLTDIENGALVNGKFQWAWLDNWSDNTPCGNADEIATVSAIESFMTHVPGVRAGGHVVFMEAIINVMEKCSGKEIMGVQNVGLTAENTVPAEPLILRYPSNVFMQWGDLPTSFATGAVTQFQYWGNGAQGYAPAHTDPNTGTLVRLVSLDNSAAGNQLCTQHRSTATCDVFKNSSTADVVDVTSYVRYQDDPLNGLAFYMPGNQINNGPSQLRMILDTLIALPLSVAPAGKSTFTVSEVSRSSPVVASVGGQLTQYQGSYETVDPAASIPVYNSSADASLFEFPYQKGHYRGFVAGTNSAIFDGANGIPPATAAGCGSWFSSSCRTVFTNTVTGRNPARVFVSTANRSTLSPLLAPSGMDNTSMDLLISHILAGHWTGTNWVPALGGIDRSTGAVIEPSPIAGPVRPTMAYVGASDGMLHAFCVDTVAPCSAKGEELWAFMPRIVLSRLRNNQGKIQGSPKVADVFGDFTGSGFRTWKTVLTIVVTGSAGVTGSEPSVYALDVTNPGNPSILWEYSAPANRGTFEIGNGVNVSMGPVTTSAGTKNLTFVETNNGGTGAAGIWLGAIDTETGRLYWSWNETYPAPRDAANDDPVPTTGQPGGVTLIDDGHTGLINRVIVPSLYGEVWELDAATGTNRFGTKPVFSFSTDYHPIGAPPTAYYKGGQLTLAVASGGYIEPNVTSWAPASVDQYVVAFSADPAANLVPISESGGNPYLILSVDLGPGERAYGQAVVSGNELFVVSDSADVNDSLYGYTTTNTATLSRINLGTGAVVATQGVADGAASVDMVGGKAFSANGGQTQVIDYSSSWDSNGQSTELSNIPKIIRKLWLRTQ
jgi:hypothetical protein